MNIDRAVLAFAGVMILLSLALAYLHSPYWLLLTAFAGLNMLQASVTGFCPAAMIFTPSVKGISHNPAEYTDPADLVMGADILLQVMLSLSQGDVV